ncbi:MAG: tetratricopeptide repeat protein, partial [Planctomycetota bacterium]
LGAASTDIATKHGTDERALVRQLQEDLDWVTMKALEKDRTRRYSSASDLAADLRRHLAHEPVLAGPPEAGYRLRKFVRRNRTLVTAGALVLSALVVGVVGATWGMLEASEQARLAGISQADAERAREAADRERDEAREARDAERSQKEEAERARAAEAGLRREADRARGAERESRLRAERQAENARAATEFLVGILELANPEVSLQSELSMREMLDRAGTEVGRSLANQPEAEGSVRTTLGRAYLSIGQLEQADTHLRRALEIMDANGSPGPEEQYRVLWPLMRVMIGRASFRQDDLLLALRWLALVPRMFGDEYAELRDAFPPPTLTVAPDVEGIASMARAELRPGNPLRLVVADYLWACGWYAALLGAPDEYTLLAFEESLGIRRSELPESHPDIAAPLNALVDLLNRAGRFDRAEELIQESLGIRREILPGDDVGIAASLSLLGECLAGQGQREEAEELLRSSYETIRAARSPGHPELAAALSRLVRACEGWQEEREARTHRRALAQALASSPLRRS